MEVALSPGAAEALQVAPEPVEEKQGVLSRLWGRSASPVPSQDPTPGRGSPVPQEAVVVGEVHQGVVVGLVGGESVAHREALKGTSGDLQQPLIPISLPSPSAPDKTGCWRSDPPQCCPPPCQGKGAGAGWGRLALVLLPQKSSWSEAQGGAAAAAGGGEFRFCHSSLLQSCPVPEAMP